MSSYSELRLDSFYLGAEKDFISPIIMTLFLESDKRICEITPSELKLEHDHLVGELDEEEKIIQIQYACSASVAKDRLELMGFTRKVAKEGFKRGLKAEIKRHKKWMREMSGDFLSTKLQILSELSLENWLNNLEKIIQQNLKSSSFKDSRGTESNHLIEYMLDSKKFEWYGFPGYEYRYFIRLLLDIFPDAEELVYDLTGLVIGEWYEKTDELIENADEFISGDFLNSQRIIVLTEGLTDKYVLERSLNLLYPHLANYFRFFNFEEFRFGGGAGELAKVVKAFGGAGITNKIVALFDNDTAALSAIQSLSKVKLPKNIVILRYPDLITAKNYPTLGPTGIVLMNVNGLAGSIELYFGKDVLTAVDGNLIPIQWKGYDQGLKKYQGEVITKDKLLDKFTQKLKLCEANPNQIVNYDWTGIKLILDTLRSAFHKQDAEEILEAKTIY